MRAATIDALRDSLMLPRPALSPEYVAKMMHPVPDAPVVDRAAFIVERCRGRRVLELGATGALHDALREASGELVGIDREPSDGVLGFDLDDVTVDRLPVDDAFPDLVVAGEVLEHLSNPGWLLTRLRRQFACPLIVSVPNALSTVALTHIRRGVENVNRDHVAYYSWKTLTTLLARAGYVVREWGWYHGEPRVAEGLVVFTE